MIGNEIKISLLGPILYSWGSDEMSGRWKKERVNEVWWGSQGGSALKAGCEAEQYKNEKDARESGRVAGTRKQPATSLSLHGESTTCWNGSH